jgi:hypothetical protein
VSYWKMEKGKKKGKKARLTLKILESKYKFVMDGDEMRD